MKIKLLVLPALTLTVLFGCTVLGSKSWYTDYTREPLLKQASFDMNCAKEKLRDQPLTGYMTIGISGCKKRATYKYIDRIGWVAN